MCQNKKNDLPVISEFNRTSFHFLVQKCPSPFLQRFLEASLLEHTWIKLTASYLASGFRVAALKDWTWVSLL